MNRWFPTFLIAAGSTAAATAVPARETTYLPSARSDYVEYCAGCHGLDGNSAPAPLPQLKGRIGYFLCTDEGRRYIARLPNVVHAPVAGAQALADLLNYVVFDIGQGSAPAGARAYRAEEVATLSNTPLSGVSLVRERARIVGDVLRRCPATPRGLRDFGSGIRASASNVRSE